MPSSGTWRLETEAGFRDEGRWQSEFAPELPMEYERRMPSGYRYIWLIPLLLNLSGIVMIASLTSRSGHIEGVSFYLMALRQLQFLVLGLVSMYFCCLVPLSLMRKLSGLLWIIAVFMVFATLIPGLGVKVGGARRWLSLFGRRFQPLEVLTLAIPMFLADRLSASKRDGFECFYKPTLWMAVISAVPFYFQPNMGGMILVFAICLSMHAVNRGWKYPVVGGLLLLFVFIYMVYAEGYRMRRLMAFLNPWDDPMNKGFQIIQGLVAFSNGGVLGVGVGRGLQKLNYLPAAHTDYIFAAIGEEFGLIGTLLIISLYAFWTFKAYMIYRRSDSPYISVLIWGITASIIFPMFVNLGGVMKLMPLTGIPLPFISAGGSSLVLMWVKVGILLRIGKELAARGEARGYR